jgi:single-stranded-DNA-specific exonuclease
MRISQRAVYAVPQFQQTLHPTLATILAARGVVNDEQLQLSLQSLLPPSSLLGLDQAVALLWQALQQQQRILIVADYDADGATSCALALLGLRAFGFQHVAYLVPNRFDYGYGLTPPIVELAKRQQPDLLITVDNGIASHAGVALARSYGDHVACRNRDRESQSAWLWVCQQGLGGRGCGVLSIARIAQSVARVSVVYIN